MTIEAINERLEIETTIHETAQQIVELIAAAKAKVAKLDGDEDDAETKIIELVTEE